MFYFLVRREKSTPGAPQVVQRDFLCSGGGVETAPPCPARLAPLRPRRQSVRSVAEHHHRRDGTARDCSARRNQPRHWTTLTANATNYAKSKPAKTPPYKRLLTGHFRATCRITFLAYLQIISICNISYDSCLQASYF